MASTLKINNLDTASGTDITIPTGKKLVVTDTGGVKVRVISGDNSSIASKRLKNY